jgi:cytochrome c oxidase subunit 2
VPAGNQSPTGDGESPITGESTSGAQAGEALFAKLNCSACHVAGAGHVAPSLDGLFGQSVTLDGGKTVIADEEYIRQSILFPHEKIVEGYEPVMPSFEGQVNEEEISSLVAYIKSLGK